MEESHKIGDYIRLIFALSSSMQLAAPQPRRHKILMSFRYWNVIFFDTDRMRTALPRRARFNSDEVLIEFAQREGMEHARAFLTSAGGAVSSIETHDPRLLLREFVVLFRIFAAHSATCPKCNQVSVADSNVAMPRMTAELFREILDSIEGDIETLRSKRR
jgi:hypothetical protein